jgi:predicted enzyme related to lactoylglutathione lyase
MPGYFVWYDYLARDPKEAVAFYTHVVGWISLPFESGYTMFVGKHGPLAGTAELPEQAYKVGALSHWTSNVHVRDVDATAREVRKLGGRVLVEPHDFPKVGRA